jgi:type I restriction enzyme R subunit
LRCIIANEVRPVNRRSFALAGSDLAPEMQNRRNRPSAFLKIDLPNFIEARGIVSRGEGGKQVLVEEYRQRVESRILEIVANHPARKRSGRGKG